LINLNSIWIKLLLSGGSVFAIQWGCYLFFKQKKAHQPIYELSPSSHQKKKLTPSFGGVGIVLSLFFSVIFFNDFNLEVYWLLVCVLLFASIGFFDDFIAIKKTRNKGFSAAVKFGLQGVVSVTLIYMYSTFFYELSLFEWALYIFVFMATPNATNLSDGLDGLLAGLSLITCAGFYVYFLHPLFWHLQPAVSSLFLVILVFLWFNQNPAKIFMGDTGSLALGAAFAGISLMAKNPFILIPFGAIYIIETLSVIIQVIYFKCTKRRVFLMAPLHHHFELLGFSEKNVVRLFWFMGFVFIMIYVVNELF